MNQYEARKRKRSSDPGLGGLGRLDTFGHCHPHAEELSVLEFFRRERGRKQRCDVYMKVIFQGPKKEEKKANTGKEETGTKREHRQRGHI